MHPGSWQGAAERLGSGVLVVHNVISKMLATLDAKPQGGLEAAHGMGDFSGHGTTAQYSYRPVPGVRGHNRMDAVSRASGIGELANHTFDKLDVNQLQDRGYGTRMDAANRASGISELANHMFDQLDTNQDGVIDREEFTRQGLRF